MPKYLPIIPAELDWHDGLPSCRRHQDIYFSRDGGAAESRHVFLRGNRLPERWQRREHFSIGETGFGTGLNFLCALDCWRETAPAEARLFYLAVEKYPLAPADLARVLAGYPAWQESVNRLMAQYPPPVNGMHHLEFAGGRVVLTLLLGDAASMLSTVDGPIDAWFLDGFAPSRNPDIWSPALFAELARLSRPRTSFATFTAAGMVRRGLADAGFVVATDRGFGRKRDMLRGHFEGAGGESRSPPWFRYPAAPSPAGRAIVIGAGIAGCSIAEAIARGGREVLLLEREDSLAAGASGNPGAVIMPRLGLAMTPDTRFHLHAYLYALGWLRRLGERFADLPWYPHGVLQVIDGQRRGRLQALDLPVELVEFVDAATATRLAGIPVGRDALFYPGAGWLRPAELCRRLVAGDGIEVMLNREVSRLQSTERGWRIDGGGGCIAEAPVVVIANGADAARLAGDRQLPLRSVRGQLALLRATASSRPLKLPICADGYLLPASEGIHPAGASYAVDDDSLQANAADNRAIVERIGGIFPRDPGFCVDGSRVALRAATPDYLPLIGALPEIAHFDAVYADLHHGGPSAGYPAARYRPGIFISAGHGSRGLVTAPLAAALIAAMVAGEPPPLPRVLCDAVQPSRFRLRALKRGA